ncbi:MAG: hypothetical protein Q9169_002251 [Polycauliona sp. 2 TL-2023]
MILPSSNTLVSLFTLLLTTLTLLLPTTVSTPTPADTSLSLLPPGINGPLPPPSKDKNLACYWIVLPWKWVDIRNCHKAANKLPPASSERTEFHSKGIHNAGYMPLAVMQDDCRIEIELIDRNKYQMSTWTEVHDALRKVLFGCAKSKKPLPLGGWTAGGKYRVGPGDGKATWKDGIKIKVMKNPYQ